MPRRDYLADLAAVQAGLLPTGIANIEPGKEDATFLFHYAVDNHASIALQAMVPEVSEYPNTHSWFVYTIDDDAPAAINKVLDDFGSSSLRIHPMLCKLATVLQKVASGEPDAEPDWNDLMEEDLSDGGSVEYVLGDDGFDEHLTSDSDPGTMPVKRQTSTMDGMRGPLSNNQKSDLRRKVGMDLHLAKEAGLRVSSAGRIFDGNLDCFVTLAIRVARLGIQEDTLKAWQMAPEKYVVLVIRYPNGYFSLDQALAKAHTCVHLRMVVADRYKIPYSQARRLFEKTRLSNEDAPHSDETKIDPLFIDGPLNELLNNRFLALVRLRQRLCASWKGASDYYNDSQGKKMNDSLNVSDEYYAHDPVPPHLPAVATADHLAEQRLTYSLPLLAMQLALRHLVRCTEFCLVCHGRVKDSFEALKPYVCSKPLCLYQYMSLGFGPSIENEVVSQPDVADLLISFCYRAAGTGVLNEKLPNGMRLVVPPLLSEVTKALGQPALAASVAPRKQAKPAAKRGQKNNNADPPAPPKIFKGVLDEDRAQLHNVTADDGQEVPAKAGQWIYITAPGYYRHCRVKEVYGDMLILGPLIPAIPKNAKEPFDANGDWLDPGLPKSANNVFGGPPESPPSSTKETKDSPCRKPVMRDVHGVVWDRQFEELSPLDQQAMILHLLNALPSVQEMRTYIIQAGQKEGCLARWIDRIPPASLGILRWIIASNRSCIMQVDSIDDEPAPEAGIRGLPPSFLQFRFAQGAPDKEQRFVEAVNAAQKRWKSAAPTIFAWHGSPLHNWHNIIREGLNFNVTANGRAYGHGVYHSLDMAVSMGYCGVHVGGLGQAHLVTTSHVWPQSRLQIDFAMCINEIVNAPAEFTSYTPHLVVQHVDWIQTRFMLVRTESNKDRIQRQVATEFLEQDAQLRPNNSTRTMPNSELGIPATAVPASRRTQRSKKRKAGARGAGSPQGYESEASAASDVDLYAVPVDDDADVAMTDEPEAMDVDPDDAVRAKPAKRTTPKSSALLTKVNQLTSPRGHRPEPPTTDFRPGTLDHLTLPLIAAPSYATPQATRSLQRELSATLATQSATPAHELGWYLDPELVGNLYQWIVELHTFDPSLPLAQDLQARHVPSIVLELRFGAQFPYAPPFVRVVRPRFLGFQAGGGGHVTLGGAMCMELLTNNGWNPASTIEAVLLQVRMALANTEPRPARLDAANQTDYGIGEAVVAFRRACELHGWQVPAELGSIAAA